MLIVCMAFVSVNANPISRIMRGWTSRPAQDAALVHLRAYRLQAKRQEKLDALITYLHARRAYLPTGRYRRRLRRSIGSGHSAKDHDLLVARGRRARACTGVRRRALGWPLSRPYDRRGPGIRAGATAFVLPPARLIPRRRRATPSCPTADQQEDAAAARPLSTTSLSRSSTACSGPGMAAISARKRRALCW